MYELQQTIYRPYLDTCIPKWIRLPMLKEHVIFCTYDSFTILACTTLLSK